MSRNIPIVTQAVEDYSTMVVCSPAIPPATPKPIKKSKFTSTKTVSKQLDLFGNVVPPPTTKVVKVKAFSKYDGTVVASHKRTVKSSKSSKSVKANNATKPNKQLTALYKKVTSGMYTKDMFVGVDKNTKQEAFSTRISEMLALTRKQFADSVKEHQDQLE